MTVSLILTLSTFYLSASVKGAFDYLHSADNDLELVRARVIEYVMRGNVNEESVGEIMNSITPGGYWENINYEDVSRTGFQHSDHLNNMITMARAFKKPGNRFTGSQQLKKAINLALDFWIEHDFRCDNWWWNDMGTPLYMINLMLIMDDDLTENQRVEGLKIAGRAHMKSAGARPGGDLIRVATLWGKQGLFMRNTEILEEVIEIMAGEMKTTTGRGIKPDMSQHHRNDNVISTLTYGMYLPGQFSLWALFIDGTRFSFPEPAMELLVDFFLDGVCRSMVYGKYPDPGARNRGISRMGALNPAGAGMAEDLYLASHYRREELNNIARIRRDEIEPNLRYTSFFWHSEYFIHQRPDWFASVRMHSERNNNVESPYNGEGLLNHHYGDGSNFLTVTANEYNQIFPVWDWQRVPGTTVVQKPELPHWDEIVKKGRTSFVGAVTDNEYGAAVFDFVSPHDPLQARKSWFFFDDEYVALGSGITSSADHPVNTTISQRYLEDELFVGQNNRMSTLREGEHLLEDISWVYHDRVAYLFPDPLGVNLKNSQSTGNWRKINHSHWASEEDISAGLFTLWFDHGYKPQNVSYEYVVVPGIDLQTVGSYRNRLPVRILSNTTGLQAVRHDGLSITQIVFYEPGTIDIGNGVTLTAEKACMVMVKERGKRIRRITVSDPSRANNSLGLTVSSRIRGGGDNWKTEWSGKEGFSSINIELPSTVEMAGKSVVIDVR